MGFIMGSKKKSHGELMERFGEKLKVSDGVA